MAKLEGVKVIDMVDGEVTKISFEGNDYVLTEEQAQVGDVLFNTNGSRSQQADTYYKVVVVDEYARVLDDDGEANGWKHHVQGDYFKVYRRSLVGKKIRVTQCIDGQASAGNVGYGKIGQGVVNTGAEGKIDSSSDDGINVNITDNIDEEITSANSGDLRSFFLRHGEYELIEESAKPIVRKHVKVGDKIRITNPHEFNVGDDYDKGDVMVVKAVDDDGDVVGTDKYGGIILRREFEIIGEAKDETGNVTFREVYNRDAKVGDFLTFSDDERLPSWVKHGKKYEIIEIDDFNDPQITDEDGDEYDTCGRDFDVFEKVTNIEVGDTVKIKYGGQGITLRGFNDGDICKVIGHSHSGRFEIGDNVSGIGRVGYANAEQLEKVDDAPAPKLKEGDKVRISIPEHENTRHSRAGVTNDEIGTVESVRDNVFGEHGVTVNFPSYGGGWNGIADELELVEIEVGDTVRLNIECGDRPRYGWGQVSNGDTGTVRSINDDDINVDFPAQNGWNGERHEVELVSKASSQSGANEEMTKSDVKEGELCIVSGPTHYDDIEIGTTVRVTDANYTEGMARVMLLDGSDFDYIKPENLAEIRVEEGDIVSFNRPDGESGVGVVEDVTVSAQGVGVRSGDNYYAVIRKDGAEFTIMAKKAQRLDVVSDD